jgi:transcriptional regulator with XRE-family HTH domain
VTESAVKHGLKLLKRSPHPCQGNGRSTKERSASDVSVVAHQVHKEFAHSIRVAQSHLSALEHGQREPGTSVLLAISREFGKSVDWLLTGEEKKS